MVLDVIGDLLPIAAAVALSPFPVVAVILVLSADGARTNGLLFAGGWLVGLVGVSAVAVLLLDAGDDSEVGSAPLVDVIRLLLGLLLFALAARQWTKRPAEGSADDLPGWMSAFDDVTPRSAAGLGLALSALNPKNLLLVVAAAASIAQGGLSGRDAAVAAAVFVVLGSVTVVGAVIARLVAGDRVARPLASSKQFMLAHHGVITMVVFVLIGAKVFGAGLAGLRS